MLCLSPDQHVFTRAISELGRALGLAVVAEGSETREQLEAARDVGCDFGQGYYFSRPVRPEAAPELARRGFHGSPNLRVA